MVPITRKNFVAAIFGTATGAAVGASDSKDMPGSPLTAPADRVRNALQENLKGQFRGFLDHASVADLYFMAEVLLCHDGSSLGIHAPLPELALPAAFAEQIDAGVPCFVCVPEHLQDDAERHVKLLMAAEARA